MFTLISQAASALTLTAAVAGYARQDSRPLVSPMFSDNMVLQRDMRDPVWGWAPPGTKMTVSMDGKSGTATAGQDGKWVAKIGPFKAGGPYTLSVQGPKSVTFNNVLVGDVWICSGQSNMEFGIGNIKNPDDVINAANYPNIRLYAVPKVVSPEPLEITGGDWKVCTPNNLKTDGTWSGFSAVAYFFGKKLNEDLKIPIGLIHTSWGGTPAQAWTSAKELGDKLPEFRGGVAQIQAVAEAKRHPVVSSKDPWAEWYEKNDPGSAAGSGWAAPALDDSGWKTMKVPGMVQEAGYPEFVNQQSVVWMRKTIELPDELASKSVTINLLVDDNDATYVNGTKVGATDGYNTPRSYKIPAGVLHAGKNTIAVRVTDTQSPGGIYGDPEGINLTVDGTDKISLVGDWKIKLGAAVTGKNPLPVAFQDNPNLPTVLYNGMIQPLVPYAVKGAIWYQGESNAGQAYQYRTLLPTMITSWHKSWGQGAFPFLIVQLAGFMAPPAQPGDDQWAELREAQYMTTKKVAHAGIATAIDIGEQADIHPKNKEEVGRRLALVAESEDYHMKVASSGPVYKSMSVENGAIRLSFDHLEGGLVAKDGALKGFAIAGDDHKWVWADAKIDGNTVVVSSSKVANPVAVRYSWAAFMDSNLYNQAGLPAFPFRTDNWKGITGGPK